MAQEGRIAFPATNDDLGSVGDRKHVCRRHGYPRASSTISKDMLPSSSRAPVHDTSSRVSTREPVPFLAGPCGVNGMGPGFGPLGPVKKPKLLGILGNGLSSRIAQAKAHISAGSSASQHPLSPQNTADFTPPPTELRDSSIDPLTDQQMSKATPVSPAQLAYPVATVSS